MNNSPSVELQPPTKLGRIANREKWLAYLFLLPTILIVLTIVLIPLLANFWISFKPVRLADLQPPKLFVNERVDGNIEEVGNEVTIEYRLRNSSKDYELDEAVIYDVIPQNLSANNLDERCDISDESLSCRIGYVTPGERLTLTLSFLTTKASDVSLRDSRPTSTADSSSGLTNLEFNFENYKLMFSAHEFWEVLKVSIYYTVFGTFGALILGLFAAQMLNTVFLGRGILRGLFLFPYVAPVIAVAFSWIVFLDPFSGTINSMLSELQVVDEPINFLGSRNMELSFLGFSFEFPLALTTVIVFESWRYFPLSMLFILARMQIIPDSLYEAAEMDGATPLQKFWFISLPHLVGILAVLFLLRFIWTFNKFDDIFLLTGGAAGTRTLTVNVYEQAFAVSNLGAGAAVAVLIFVILLVFSVLFIKYTPKDE